VPKTTGRTTPAKLSVPSSDARITKGLGAQAATLRTAGCTFGTLPEQDKDMTNYHVSSDRLQWITNPPASGRHLPDWAPWGYYDEQVPDGNAVHNLEHGGVVVWLGSAVDSKMTAAIRGVLHSGDKWVVSPRAHLDGLYSVAWMQGLSCSPAALTKLGPAKLAAALDAGYGVAHAQGSAGEKDVAAYAGGMKDPVPVRDISTNPPF
jgi:hypothetical protein